MPAASPSTDSASFRIRADAFVSAAIPVSEPSRSTELFMSARRVRPAPWIDFAFENLTRFFALLVLGLLAAILVSLVYGSQLTLERYGLRFLWTGDWDPVRESFGALVPITGTLVTSLIAMLIAVP